MYKRILLAYDGSVEGRTALREGALLARQCGAKAFLLSVLADDRTFLLAEVALAGASVRIEDDFTEILNEGVARLKKLGFDPVRYTIHVIEALRAQNRLRDFTSWRNKEEYHVEDTHHRALRTKGSIHQRRHGIHCYRAPRAGGVQRRRKAGAELVAATWSPKRQTTVALSRRSFRRSILFPALACAAL
jgi:nucleotide-binding universal stress UspA family protein